MLVIRWKKCKVVVTLPQFVARFLWENVKFVAKTGVDYVKIRPVFICDYVKNSSVFICDYVKFVIFALDY